jgi:signal transduction histidine kinase/CheY-like chemotaxis protein
MDEVASLQGVTAAFSHARTAADVARAALNEGTRAVGASSGSLLLLGERGPFLEELLTVGVPPEDRARLLRLRLDEDAPLCEAARGRKAIWLESVEQLAARWPDQARFARGASVLLPLEVDDRCIGVLGLGFDGAQRFSERVRLVVLALSRQCAQALDRARLYDAEALARRDAQRAADRFRLLSQVSEALAGASGWEAALEAVARAPLAALSDWTVLEVLSPDGTWQRVARCARPDDAERAQLAGADAAPAGQAREVLESGRARVLALPAVGAPFAPAGARSCVLLPLIARGRTLGVMALALGPSGRSYNEGDLALLEAIAHRSALALDNAWLLSRAQSAERALASQAEQLRCLAESGTTFVAASAAGADAHALADLLVERLVALLASGCTVRLLTGDGKRLLPASCGARDPRHQRLLASTFSQPLDRHTSPAEAAMREGRALRMTVEQAEAGLPPGTRTVQREIGVSALAAAPLRSQDRLLGTVVVARLRGEPPFSDSDLMLLQELSDRAGMAIAQVDAQQRAEEAAAVARSARDVAEAASRAKDEFLAMLGHELRNPLAPILTALALMEAQAGELFRRERDVLDRQVRHLVRLVDDLLDVARIARGKVQLRRERLELSHALAQALDVVGPLLEQRAHHLVLEVPHQGLLVEGDPARLSQVLANLLTNAAKYTPDRGRIAVEAALEGGAVVLRVRDDGIGIAPSLLPRVFDLFVQGPQPLDRAQGGLGLGLTLVRRLVEMHGGRVEAHSDGPGSGSTFTVRLPVAPPAGTWTRREQEKQSSRPGQPLSRRVLVVDDNRDAAELLAEAMRAVGHTVRIAFDGPSALAEAERFQPELGLLDIGLPLMDGYELARALGERVPGIKLVAVTGYGQDGDRARTLQAGFREHFVKPVELADVLAAIERLAV